MGDLLLHPDTATALNMAKIDPAHALFFAGNDSSGKHLAAMQFSKAILGKDLANSPYFLNIEPENRSISIEQIRQLQNFLKLKTTGNSKIRRIVVIRDAHFMTEEAQNALLKLLEEPPEDTVIILTAIETDKLKPTIYSRVQKIRFKPVSESTAAAYFKDKYDEAAINRAYMLSQGDAGSLLALLDQSEDHSLVQAIAIAKELLSGTAFTRLTKVDELSKDKEMTMNVLIALKRIASAGLKQTIKNKTSNKTKWQNILSAVLDAEKSVKTNANQKIMLTDLLLKL